jgi:hypothetical protein
MSGIVFYGTTHHDSVVEFYTGRVGVGIWRQQPDCTILAHGDFKFGFCSREHVDACGILTLLLNDQAAVDRQYEQLRDVAEDPPHNDDTYDIYRFFATDPEGRRVEIQTFRGDG